MKRVLSLMAALIVCTSSVLAWNSESFIGDGSDEFNPYSFEPVVADDPEQVPMLMSLRPGTFAVDSSGSSVTLSGDDLFMSLTSSENMAMLCEVYHEAYSINTGQSVIDVPAFTEFRPYPMDGLPVSVASQSTTWQYRTEYFEIPESQNSGVCTAFMGLITEPFDAASPDNSLTVDLDLSQLGSFTTFGLSGLFDAQANSYPVLTGGNFGDCVQFDVLVNGALVDSFYSDDDGIVDFGSYVYDSTNRITSIQFRWYFPVAERPYNSSSRRIYVQVQKSTSTMAITVLKNNDALVGDINNAQGSINDHNAIESEWTGSMTENFEALDLSNFSFPSDLVAAFALITGIFNDLWNGMGEYKVIYVFPLTLGVVLLLIGRISKFSGRGSSRAGKGDGSA